MATRVATLTTRVGITTEVGYDFRTPSRVLVERGEVDAFIVGAFHGFVPYGAMRDDLAADLRLPVEELDAMVNRIHEHGLDPDLLLAAVKKRQLLALSDRGPIEEEDAFRGVVLAPDAYSRAYERLLSRRRDFYYRVSYEAIRLACRELKAKRLAISHLSQSNAFREDIATWTVEALADFCEASPSEAPQSLLFIGCCIGEVHLRGVKPLLDQRSSPLQDSTCQYEREGTTWARFRFPPQA